MMARDGLMELMRSENRARIQSLTGAILTRPLLMKTDGAACTWACDVKVEAYDEPLRSVPVAAASREVLYAEVGAAVTLTRHHATGRFEITGFAKRRPGAFKRVPVDVPVRLAGTLEDRTLSSRFLTFGELGSSTYGAGFGAVPLGVYGVFRGATLLEVRA